MVNVHHYVHQNVKMGHLFQSIVTNSDIATTANGKHRTAMGDS